MEEKSRGRSPLLFYASALHATLYAPLATATPGDAVNALAQGED